jgi:hypothetical protein
MVIRWIYYLGVHLQHGLPVVGFIWLPDGMKMTKKTETHCWLAGREGIPIVHAASWDEA